MRQFACACFALIVATSPVFAQDVALEMLDRLETFLVRDPRACPSRKRVPDRARHRAGDAIKVRVRKDRNGGVVGRSRWHGVSREKWRDCSRTGLSPACSGEKEVLDSAISPTLKRSGFGPQGPHSPIHTTRALTD